MRLITTISLIFLFLLTGTADAQYFYFGRNKVQYERFDWRVLKTDHFDIYYYGEFEEIAEIGAFYAEEAYEEYKQEFNHPITRRIPLIFYNTHLHFQQTNISPGFIPEGVGGFFEFLKGRVVIPYQGSLHQFRHVIRHELVHVFMVSAVYRIYKNHRLRAGPLPPLWFVEGLAEYLSTEWDAQAEMIMRDAVINGNFFSLRNIYDIYGSFLMYKEGQSFLMFFAEEYGKGRIVRLVKDFWMFEDFSNLLEYAAGESIEEIDRKWELYEKQKYYPLLDTFKPNSDEAQLILKEGYAFNPIYHKRGDNEYLYFIANMIGYTSIYRIPLDEGSDDPDIELIIQGEREEEFERFHFLQPSMDVSNEGTIAFVTKSGATDVIHFYDAEAKEKTGEFSSDSILSISAPKYNGDGSKLLFQAVDRKGFSDIYMLDVAAGELTRLTNDYYDDREPSFMKHGEGILFSSNRTAGNFEGAYNIYGIDNACIIRQITNLDADVHSPFIHTDGRLYFTCDLDGVQNMYRLTEGDSLGSSEVERVSNLLTGSSLPVPAPDSSIYFAAFENFSFNLYKYQLPDSDDLPVTAMEKPDSIGSWIAGKLMLPSERKNVEYEKEYTLDYAQSQVSTDPVFGTRGGALMSISDLLGDDRFYFLLFNTAEVQSEFLESFNVDLFRVRLGSRTNYGYGVFNYYGRRYDLRDPDEYYFERSFGSYFFLQYPFSTFDRLETSVTVANSDKEIVSGVLERKALLWSNSLSYVFDNSLWGPTGPLDGRRMRLTLGYTSDLRYSNVNYYSFIADYRHYLRLSYATALAFRGALFYNEGKEARRYFAGGSWDLRGWNRFSIRGEKIWLGSVELRVPLIDRLQIRFPFFGLGVGGIRAAAFFDAGGAWDNEYEETIGSIGVGLRMNFFNLLVFRYDIGKKIEDDFTRLQNGLFYQFFFGWDF